MPRTKPMEERSTAEIVWVFFVFPVLTGIAILALVVANVVSHGHEFTAAGWVWQAAWSSLIGLDVMTALPAAGWRESPPRADANRETRRIPRDERGWG